MTVSETKDVSMSRHMLDNKSAIDEEQLAKTFEEIVACTRLDDDQDDGILLRGSTSNVSIISQEDADSCSMETPERIRSFSTAGSPARSPNSVTTIHPTSLRTSPLSKGYTNVTTTVTATNIPESFEFLPLDNPSNSLHIVNSSFNSIFDDASASPCFGPSLSSGFPYMPSAAISSGRPSTSSSTTSVGKLPKSFLDDEWLADRIEQDTNLARAQKSASMIETVTGNQFGQHIRAFNASSSSLNVIGSMSYVGNGITTSNIQNIGSNSHHSTPPGDYVCRLCNIPGHWLKDCKLYEPRSGPSSNPNGLSTGKPYGHTRSYSATSTPHYRSVAPPHNYVCRLCNVPGHWIDQCPKFQPRNGSVSSNGSSMSLNPINMNGCSGILGPNGLGGSRSSSGHGSPKALRLPAGYICNLCRLPGHWIHQCTVYAPMHRGGHPLNSPGSSSSQSQSASYQQHPRPFELDGNG